MKKYELLRLFRESKHTAEELSAHENRESVLYCRSALQSPLSYFVS